MKEPLIKLACWLDPWMGGGRRATLPTFWRVEQRWPLWRRIPQAPAVLRGQFLLMLNIQPWPMAAGDAVATAARYLWTGFYYAGSLPEVEEERREGGLVAFTSEWLDACALRFREAGYSDRWALAHAALAWADCLEHHGSDQAVLANCPPADAADEVMKFGGAE